MSLQNFDRRLWHLLPTGGGPDVRALRPTGRPTATSSAPRGASWTEDDDEREMRGGGAVAEARARERRRCIKIMEAAVAAGQVRLALGLIELQVGADAAVRAIRAAASSAPTKPEPAPKAVALAPKRTDAPSTPRKETR